MPERTGSMAVWAWLHDDLVGRIVELAPAASLPTAALLETRTARHATDRLGVLRELTRPPCRLAAAQVLGLPGAGIEAAIQGVGDAGLQVAK